MSVWFISFWFLNSMHWLHFCKHCNVLKFSDTHKFQWTYLPLLLSLGSLPFFLHMLLLFSQFLKHDAWYSYFSGLSFSGSVAGTWFSTCYSQCWHSLGTSPRLLFFFPSSLYSEKPIYIHGFHCPLCPGDSRSKSLGVLHPLFVMSVHHCGWSRRPGEPSTWQVEGRAWFLLSS